MFSGNEPVTSELYNLSGQLIHYQVSEIHIFNYLIVDSKFRIRLIYPSSI